MDLEAGKEDLILGESLRLTPLNLSQNPYQTSWRQDTSVSSPSSLSASHMGVNQLKLNSEHRDVSPPLSHQGSDNKLAPLLHSQTAVASADSLRIKGVVKASSHPAPSNGLSGTKIPVLPTSYPVIKKADNMLGSLNASMVSTKTLSDRKPKSVDLKAPSPSPNLLRSASHTPLEKRETNADNGKSTKPKRQERSRPWAQNTKATSKKKDVTKKTSSVTEVHYEKALPPDRWAKSDGKKYVKNHKWGNSYVVETANGKVAEPGPPHWLKDDGFRTWLLEKSGDFNLEQAISKVMSKNRLKRVKGKKREDLEILSTQKKLYESYQKMKELVQLEAEACLTFQKMIRGWILRLQLRKLKEKVLLYEGKTLKTFMSEYRGVVSRIMQRKDRAPEAPFDMTGMHDYLDRKKEYEEAFNTFTEEEGTPGFLPAPALYKFCQELNLTVTDREIERIFNIVFMVCKSKADVILVVDLPMSLGEENFRIQSEFLREVVNTLHVGRGMVRIGYLPYNTEVFVSFKLGEYQTRETVLKGLDKVRYYKGIDRTDLALKQMRSMFKDTKYPRLDHCERRIAVIISEGGGYASHSTQKQAQEAIKKDKIEIYGIVLGKNANKSELLAITGKEENVLQVPNYYSLWKVKSELVRKARLRDCRFCDWQGAGGVGVSSGRGLTLAETMEFIWQISPPGIKKKRLLNGYLGNGFFNDDGDLDSEQDGNGALYDPCLGFLIKSRLDHIGVINLPAGGSTGELVPVRTWKEALARAKDFQIAEQIRKEVEEETAKAQGYTENIITEDGSEKTEDDRRNTSPNSSERETPGGKVGGDDSHESSRD